MNSPSTQVTRPAGRQRVADLIPVLARWCLGAVFIHLGLNKALEPVEFLKLVRQYDVLHSHLLLNLVTTTLPWLEVFCGLLIVLGVAVRGTAMVLVFMLVPLSVLVLLRALAIHNTAGLPFCSIQFDCGCGAGAVRICTKLLENSALTTLSVALIFWSRTRLCLRYHLVRTIPASGCA
jgi:uncharacterized membrane protein YphA (DoxX/SURF4 family)